LILKKNLESSLNDELVKVRELEWLFIPILYLIRKKDLPVLPLIKK